MLDTRGNNRRLGGKQRNSLALHVRAHQGTVGVIVLQERNHGRRDGDHHLRAHVDVVDIFAVDFDGIVAMTAGDTPVQQAAVLIHRLGGLGDDVLVFHIGRHIGDLIGQAAGSLLDTAVGRHEEAVFIGTGIRCQIVDQTDVRTFRRLNRAQTAVVAVVHVSNIKACALTAEAAGA